MNSTPMMPLEEAYDVLDTQLAGLQVGTEELPVRDASGRILAISQTSILDLPPFNKSAMDGYAVMAGDERDEYELLATISAGHWCDVDLRPGTAVKVMTGAPVPANAWRVIMVEDTTEKDGVVRIEQHKTTTNICLKAEDVQAGQVIMPAGVRLGAVEISNLIGCGIEQVEVSKPVRVAIISTGNELVNNASELKPGQIMNTNGPLLSGLAEQYGLAVTSQLLVRDSVDDTEATLKQALAKADLVMVSGGISAGDFDFVPEVIEKLGLTIHFRRVAIKPGKPTLFATGNGKALIGLPGNPAAVYLAFHILVMRAVALLSGARCKPRMITLALTNEYSRRNAGRVSFEPAKISADGLLIPCTYHGSAHLAALIIADGLMVIPRGVKRISTGERVGFLPLRMGWCDA